VRGVGARLGQPGADPGVDELLDVLAGDLLGPRHVRYGDRPVRLQMLQHRAERGGDAEIGMERVAGRLQRLEGAAGRSDQVDEMGGGHRWTLV
jgi:hypothetical protein